MPMPLRASRRFILQLPALVTFCYWGYLHGDGATRWIPALGLPFLVAVIWEAFVASSSAVKVPDIAKLALGLAVPPARRGRVGRRGATDAGCRLCGDYRAYVGVAAVGSQRRLLGRS